VRRLCRLVTRLLDKHFQSIGQKVITDWLLVAELSALMTPFMTRGVEGFSLLQSAFSHRIEFLSQQPRKIAFDEEVRVGLSHVERHRVATQSVGTTGSDERGQSTYSTYRAIRFGLRSVSI
jgi:hypothetical protein